MKWFLEKSACVCFYVRLLLAHAEWHTNKATIQVFTFKALNMCTAILFITIYKLIYYRTHTTNSTEVIIPNNAPANRHIIHIYRRIHMCGVFPNPKFSIEEHKGAHMQAKVSIKNDKYQSNTSKINKYSERGNGWRKIMPNDSKTLRKFNRFVKMHAHADWAVNAVFSRIQNDLHFGFYGKSFCVCMFIWRWYWILCARIEYTA